MNCNMTFKSFLTYFTALLLLLFVSFGIPNTVLAQEFPKGDILIIFSDNADKQAVAAVNDLVEQLTYQSFEVSYGPASWSMEYLDRFSHIICYDLNTYPMEFSKKLEEYENSKLISPHILFVGSRYLKDYLDYTGRSGRYQLINSSIGQVQYSFNGLDSRTSLVKEDYFIFLKQFQYKSGELNVDDKKGYFCATAGAITHIPIANINDNMIKAAFNREVAQWKWPYKGIPHVFAQYILIDRVYPYEDQEKLLKVVNLLISKKTPFVISVMPMYTNGDYPSMTHFCEILRYAQANGGAVIIHAPINQMVDFKTEVVLDYLARAMVIYNKQGVYPLALQVPHNWMFDKDTIEIMSHFRTVFTSDEMDPYLKPDEMNRNEVYQDGHQWVGNSISLDDTGVSNSTIYSTAVSISMKEDYSKISKKIQTCRNSFVPLKSLWDMDHTLWMDKELLNYKSGNLILNDKKIDLDFTPSVYTKQYDYHRNILQRFSKDLTSQNRKLILIVTITSVIFLFLILWARYTNRKRYFLSPESGSQPDEKYTD
ncbi:DUF2334 domain-containing protein [Clostridium boliviensis]|uniref:DUF2334 domain-containing protein n=1 Tax=Clostridium boliviensis TaxID=318465 RepID=A0ABU4GQ43_9CLOT|nr:DUF2334 domain-containing protein [Clostridium boliviensis]MDW2799757.1 DUF2334 domain-containing protein [Clostridium boliviensis]